MNRLLGRLLVVFVLFLMTFIGYSSHIFVIWPWYGGELSVELLTLLVPTSVMMGLIFFTIYMPS
jgi:palmitoyltransferase